MYWSFPANFAVSVMNDVNLVFLWYYFIDCRTNQLSSWSWKEWKIILSLLNYFYLLFESVSNFLVYGEMAPSSGADDRDSIKVIIIYKYIKIYKYINIYFFTWLFQFFFHVHENSVNVNRNQCTRHTTI